MATPSDPQSLGPDRTSVGVLSRNAATLPGALPPPGSFHLAATNQPWDVDLRRLGRRPRASRAPTSPTCARRLPSERCSTAPAVARPGSSVCLFAPPRGGLCARRHVERRLTTASRVRLVVRSSLFGRVGALQLILGAVFGEATRGHRWVARTLTRAAAYGAVCNGRVWEPFLSDWRRWQAPQSWWEECRWALYRPPLPRRLTRPRGYPGPEFCHHSSRI
jgi:hypothetical protein